MLFVSFFIILSGKVSVYIQSKEEEEDYDDDVVGKIRSRANTLHSLLSVTSQPDLTTSPLSLSQAVSPNINPHDETFSFQPQADGYFDNQAIDKLHSVSEVIAAEEKQSTPQSAGSQSVEAEDIPDVVKSRSPAPTQHPSDVENKCEETTVSTCLPLHDLSCFCCIINFKS